MAKIKVKKYMNLAELIKWAGENRIKEGKFLGSSGVVLYFYFDENSWISIDEPNLIEPEETFEVEVEEEIDENTVIPKLVYHYAHNGMSLITTRSEKSISEVLKINTKAEGFMNITFYMLNDDMTMTLLWRNGEMVE
ncbi:hypothetical protein [Staphylococcus chromogenes]|uniref:hypothetical protein n=1 Tax=Staphylococcus chromogenes TaxID=46126 RepID=UPI000E6A548C|nr:hypothetical protein [Staphylococcus chromogenes]RIM01256.1 hypothetical protein BU683_11575 [Staphylococcus chromogenes]